MNFGVLAQTFLQVCSHRVQIETCLEKNVQGRPQMGGVDCDRSPFRQLFNAVKIVSVVDRVTGVDINTRLDI
jgi:hypothetical protein